MRQFISLAGIVWLMLSVPLAGHAAEVTLAPYGAVQHGIADDDVVFSLLDLAFRWRIDDQLSARQALADVVVGFTRQLNGHTMRKPGTEGLAGGAPGFDLDGVLGQSGKAVPLGDTA